MKKSLQTLTEEMRTARAAYECASCHEQMLYELLAAAKVRKEEARKASALARKARDERWDKASVEVRRRIR